jgi:predicted dienelactone hydrolase
LSTFRALVAGLATLLLAALPAGAVGFAYGGAPNPDDQTIEIAIWYPSDAPAATQPIGLFTEDVALNGPVSGDGLPLVVISHGTGGSAAMHYDTALALAEAGFVVVAPNHTGDDYNDRKYSFTARNFIDRSKHVSRVIDFMLNGWEGHDHIDSGHIGIFGHSAGGATALIVIGGNPDFYLAMLFCRDHPDDWGCQQRSGLPGGTPTNSADWESPAEWNHDPRVTAAVIAAPAMGHTFTKVGLENVTAPVQLWRAENDRIATNKWSADIIKDALPHAPEDHFVPNASHYDFLAPCNEALAKTAPEICESDAAFDRAAFHEDMNRAVVAFFKSRLAPP